MHSRFKYGPVCFIAASAKEISKSIGLKSAIFYGRLNRSSQPGELLSRLATSSIIMCPQLGGQHPRILTCKLYPSVNIRKIVCPVGGITNGLSGVCLFDIWLTELSNFCPQLQHRNQEMCFCLLSRCFVVSMRLSVGEKGDGNPSHDFMNWATHNKTE